ncbi:hypothetical protein IC229_23810 [Spirosoma sp. BT702]|uniref:ACT domain-containing protein n=1 Tax=Spirosoma profusum TaxID=2771354 RepID=A0A927AUD2_9BACT|nr:hypothetical protein [Spirosoma profusum]MBD2703692.1 hypothetical protein [Spirosoma profusum]
MASSKPSPVTNSPENLTHVTYQIAGFDRLNFVSDITQAVPQSDNYLIRAICFEADGVQANGLLTVQMQGDTSFADKLIQRLQLVRGLVSVRTLVQ